MPFKFYVIAAAALLGYGVFAALVGLDALLLHALVQATQ